MAMRDLLQRARENLLADLGLKLVAIVIAVLLYAFMHRPVEPAPPEPEGCPKLGTAG